MSRLACAAIACLLVAAKVTVKLAAGRIGARGPVRVRLSNANTFAVTGTLSGRTAKAIGTARRLVKLGGNRVNVAAGGRQTVELALSKALRRVLTRKRKLVLGCRSWSRIPPATAAPSATRSRHD